MSKRGLWDSGRDEMPYDWWVTTFAGQCSVLRWHSMRLMASVVRESRVRWLMRRIVKLNLWWARR